MGRLILRFIALPLFLWIGSAFGQQQYAVDTLLASPEINRPSALALVPGTGGRFFFTEKDRGAVRFFEEPGVPPRTFVQVAVAGGSIEEGLLGLALHPAFPDSPFVYILYDRDPDRAAMLVRYTDLDGTAVHADTLLVIPRSEPEAGSGNAMHFGPDGKLYVAVSSAGPTENLRAAAALSGTILRLNYDGTIPADNPFVRSPVWSFGHRGTFNFTFDSTAGSVYCTGIGPDGFGEVRPVMAGDVRPANPIVRFAEGPQPLLLSGLAVYHGSAFPRLRGRLLVTGNRMPGIRSFASPGDMSPEDSLASTVFMPGMEFSDIDTGPHGDLYLTSGVYAPARILRVRPLPARFASTPVDTARQGEDYSYTPAFEGTPPMLTLLEGPEGMAVDSTSWSVKWRPTNEQALEGHQHVVLLAENGAGSARQEFTVTTVNVNDPPAPPLLLSPEDNTFVESASSDMAVTFRWRPSTDPDRDTVRYTVQVDTTDAFVSRALHGYAVDTADSLRVFFPRTSKIYFWRVIATDGTAQTVSLPSRRLLEVEAKQSPVAAAPLEPKESVLEQNYPNPFNPATSIKYTIPTAGFVRLAVFNLIGQEVALIFEGIQDAGVHEVAFNKGELPSGLYFYRIQAPGFVETKKMVVTK